MSESNNDDQLQVGHASFASPLIDPHNMLGAVMDNSRTFDLGPQNVAASSYTYVDGFDNAVLGTSDHAAIYHGEGNTILNSPWTQLYHSHHVIVEGGEKMTLHSLSYVHVTPDGHRPLNESDWDALTKRVRGIEEPKPKI